MATISKLVVSLSANSAKLVSELAKSKRSVGKWAKDIRAKANTVAKVMAGAGAAAAAAIGAIVNRQAAEIDKLAKKAASLNIDTGNLQKLRYQAELSGVATDGLDKSLQKMLKTVSDGKAGLSTANRAFEQLGLSAEQLSTMSADEQFYAIAEAMKGITDQADKTRIAMDIFGRSGADLVNTLGSDLAETGAEFEKLGVRITSQQAAMVESFNDSKSKLGTIWDGFLNQITIHVAPAFQMLVEDITQTTMAAGGMGNVAMAVMENIAAGAAFVADSFRGIKLVVTTAWLGITKMSALLIETIRSFESVYIDLMSLLGKDIEPSVRLKLDAETEKQKIGMMQKEIDEMLNGELNSVKVKKYFNGLRERVSTAGQAPAEKLSQQNTDSTKENTTATKALTEALNKDSKASVGTGGAAWEKIFGRDGSGKKQDLKISRQFSDTAKALQAAINRQDTDSMAYFVEKAQKTLDAVAGRGPTGINFGNERDHDIDGMQSVLDKLVSQMTQQPEKVGSIDINVMTDGKTMSGKLMGDPSFLKQLKQFVDSSTKETARAVAR